jgi:hypothetical protein
MTDGENRHPARSGVGSCGFAWCTTDHGHTTHPDDEDHRDDGIPVDLEVRDNADAASATVRSAEVGLLRRRSDDQTWLVVDDGSGLDHAISLDSARRLVRAIARNPALARELR